MAGTRERDVAAAVAEQLRVLMARQKIRTLPLARASGIPNSTLASILNGARAIDVDQLARICQQLGVEPGEVLAHALDSMRAAAFDAPDMSVVDEVLSEDTTLTPKQKASVREQAARGDTPSGHGHRERSHRKVL